jgi:hypothetical protein
MTNGATGFETARDFRLLVSRVWVHDRLPR